MEGENPTAERIAHAVTAVAPQPGWWVIVGTAVLAAFLTLARGWNIISTIVHESGHAAANLVTGGGVHCIEITSHEAGTTFGWKPTRFSAITSALAGYIAPSLAGLGIAKLLTGGFATAVLACGVAVTVLVLMVTRDVLTFSVVTGVGAICAALVWWGPLWLHTWSAYTLMWLLLLGELPGVTVLGRARWHGLPISETEDAGQLHEFTGLPGSIWIAGWYAGIAWCIWTASGWVWPW
ncbi:M50 family metallopeptidase [Salinifilum ghardaiensis]